MYHPKNYKANCLVPIPDDYLNGQSLGVLKDMKYGASNLDDAGCGPLAVYNALRYLGRPMSLPKVMRELETYAAPIGARFGTSAILMMIFFFRHHVRFRIIRRIKKIDRSEAGIMMYWTKRPVFSGGHYVFFKRDEDGRMTVYNRYSNRDEIYRYESVGEMVPQKRIILTFALKDKAPGTVTNMGK